MTESTPPSEGPQQEPQTPEQPAQAQPPMGQQPPPSGGEGQAPPPGAQPPPGGEVPPEARTFGMLCHLLGIFTGFLGPLIIWLIKKDQSKFADYHGKEALNFQLTVLIGWIASIILVYVFCIGTLTGLAVLVIDLIFLIKGTLAANKGESYRYPISIRFIK